MPFLRRKPAKRRKTFSSHKDTFCYYITGADSKLYSFRAQIFDLASKPCLEDRERTIMRFLKAVLYLAVIGGLIYLGYHKIIKPFIGAGKCTVTNFYFGNATIPKN